MIAIVTDSTAYMTRQEACGLDVRIVPMTYYVNGCMYNETYSDENGAFEKLIGRDVGKCKTSQAGVSAFLSTFEELLREGHCVLCLTISSRLSGTYSSASLAAREIGSSKIRVVDSLTTAGGLYFLIKEARRLCDCRMELEEVALKIEGLRCKTEIAFSVDDMTPLRESGRLGIVRKSVGTILNVKPLLLCKNGSVVSDGIARGRREQVGKLIAQVPEGTKDIAVHFIGDPGPAAFIADEIKRQGLSENVGLKPLGPVLAIHLGMGVIGVAWMRS